jgi:hypothetical protein
MSIDKIDKLLAKEEEEHIDEEKFIGLYPSSNKLTNVHITKSVCDCGESTVHKRFKYAVCTKCHRVRYYGEL